MSFILSYVNADSQIHQYPQAFLSSINTTSSNTEMTDMTNLQLIHNPFPSYIIDTFVDAYNLKLNDKEINFMNDYIYTTLDDLVYKLKNTNNNKVISMDIVNTLITDLEFIINDIKN